ncbi:MAG TPA: LysM peptidoglycan-binding domain-containing protein [Halanaerobiales bacterium]|nr:LysM peptidoglycan-binding domain-containing protein [Halanaerobiales bacterium]HPZ63459.1 LysM peptidoglycan-binding domain-containing protein [Halanaerobiales bacterium]HQD04695.1 LysM peptidoglycan-binding domain-containing protein [Halanaerobiales bacterium]
MNYRKILIVFCLFIFISQFGIMAATTKINMNFKGADIRDVLRTIAELAKVNLVTDSSVSGEITVHLKDLSFEDALTLVTQAHGLAYKWYGNTVVVATPQRIEQLYASIEIKTIDVKHADLFQLQDILRNLYPELNIVPDQRNNKLILQGKRELLVEAERLTLQLDTEKEAIADIIAIPADKGEFLLDYLQKVYPELFVESDGRGNFVLYGTPYDLENAKLLLNKLVEQLEEKVGDYQVVDVIESIRVRHVDVAYIKELVNEMYPGVNIIADRKNNQLIYNGPEVDLRRIKELVAIIDLDYGLAVEDSEIIPGSDDKATRIVQIDYANLEDIEGIIQDLYPGLVYRINSQKKEFVLSGRRDELDDLVALLEKVDTPRKQVIIEARVEEVSTTDLMDLGINPEEMSRIELIDKNRDGYIDGIGLTFAQFINILDTRGRSNTLARPRLMTLSGEEASLLIGDRIPVTVEKVEEGRVVMTVEYIEAGINLVFTPWVTSDNKINLRVNPQISSIGESIGTALPPINTREAETTIRLDDGETFAIGGLIQDDIVESVSKVPLLGDIPIFGHIFKSKSTQNLKTELIIFITPHIVKEDQIVETIQENLKNREIISESIEQREEKSSVLETILARGEVTGEGPVTGIEKALGELIAEEEKGAGNEVQLIREEEVVLLNSDEIRAILNKNEGRRKNLPISNPVRKTLVKEEENDKLVQAEIEDTATEVISTEDTIEKTSADKAAGNISSQEIVEEETRNREIDLTHYYLYDYRLDSNLTIDEVAEKFAVDKELLQEINPGLEMRIGTSIKIPVEKSRIYVMEKGDTLWKLCTIYGVSVEEIKELNNIEDESNISVGTVIILPE